MQQQIFIHLEKHYLPYVEKQIVCYSSGTCHYSGLFSDVAAIEKMPLSAHNNLLIIISQKGA